MTDRNSLKPMEAPPAETDKGRYEGKANAAPYALSRMAPAYDLVNAAEQIQNADRTLAAMTGGKLGVIAEQISRLQEQARQLLEKARRDAELHRAECRFEKRAGDVYHLYRRVDGVAWFSRLAPDEWVTAHTNTFEGSYRLELDMSFTRLDKDEDAAPLVPLAAWMGKGETR